MEAAAVRRIWSEILPEADEKDLALLRLFADNSGEPVTPYKVYKQSGLNPATAYRRVRKLSSLRLIRESEDGRGYKITALGCILLYTHGMIGDTSLARCIGKCWGLQLDKLEALAFLAVLGHRIMEKRLAPCEATAGGISSAAVHVIEILEAAIEEQFRSGTRIRESLERKAREIGVSPETLATAIRVSLRGLASMLPITLLTPRHKVVLLTHGRVITPVAYECSEECEHYEGSLGIECPQLWEEVRTILAGTLGIPADAPFG